MLYQPLPPALVSFASKRRIVNIVNKDDKCFLWCIVAHLFPQDKNPTRQAPLRKLLDANPDCLNLDGVKFPMTLDRISHFSQQKPHLPPIIVIGVEEGLSAAMITARKGFYPMQIPQNLGPREMPLALIYLDPPNAETQGHYVLARDPLLLFHHRPQRGTRYVCWRHWQGFSSEELYKKHLITCGNYKQQVQPAEGGHDSALRPVPGRHPKAHQQSLCGVC